MHIETTVASDALLHKYSTMEYILLGDLRDILEETPDEHTPHWLAAVLDALLDTLPREFELQDEGGYLHEVIEQYPSWSVQVENLQRERDAMFGKLSTLRNRVQDDLSIEEIAGELREDLRDWMTRLTAHQRHERRMLQTAFNLEVGGGD